MVFQATRPVCEGSKLAIIAPAGPFNEEAFAAGVSWLRERYEISYSEEIFSKCGYFAGTDDRRLSEILEAVEDPEIDGILCARGGYGTTRLLPKIDIGPISKANKTIVGFSDITALHSTWARAGVRSVHAPMVAALGNAPEKVQQDWIEAVEGTGSQSSHSLEILCPGSAAGRLFGGNLAVLAALTGTPFMPPLEGTILFLEDVGERPYRIDRMLTSMAQAGWFDQIAGLVLGAFTEGDPGKDGVSIDNVLEDQFGCSPFPVLRGLSAGHVKDNVPLPFGTSASIGNGQLQIAH